jgi:hypothetical protein
MEHTSKQFLLPQFQGPHIVSSSIENPCLVHETLTNSNFLFVVSVENLSRDQIERKRKREGERERERQTERE